MSDRDDGEWTWTDQYIPLQEKKSWFERIVFVAGIGLLLVVIGFIVIAIRAGYTALKAETTMQVSRCVTRLVEEFVRKNRRWPASWKELEAINLPQNQQEQLAAFVGPWPDCAEEVKKRVDIDFQPDLKEIVRQDRYDFTAIKPIGSHYEFRGYGDVDELQQTLRQYVPGLK